MKSSLLSLSLGKREGEGGEREGEEKGERGREGEGGEREGEEKEGERN